MWGGERESERVHRERERERHLVPHGIKIEVERENVSLFPVKLFPYKDLRKINSPCSSFNVYLQVKYRR